MEEGETEDLEEPEPPDPGGFAADEPELEPAAGLRLARLPEAAAATGADAALVAAAVAAAVAAGAVTLVAEAGLVAATAALAEVAAAGDGVVTGVAAGVTGVELTGTAVTGITEREASEPDAFSGRLPPPPEALERVRVRGWAMAGGMENGWGCGSVFGTGLSHPVTSGR